MRELFIPLTLTHSFGAMHAGPRDITFLYNTLIYYQLGATLTVCFAYSLVSNYTRTSLVSTTRVLSWHDRVLLLHVEVRGTRSQGRSVTRLIEFLAHRKLFFTLWIKPTTSRRTTVAYPPPLSYLSPQKHNGGGLTKIELPEWWKAKGDSPKLSTP